MRTDGSQAHVLLVDDDVDLSRMLRQYLEKENFKVAMDFNGKQAVAAATSGVYDAIILDVMLPTITGIELLRRIRQDSTIPIVMLTAKGDQVDRVIGLELGADDYIPKPYYPPELVARLRAVLRRRNDTRAGASEDVELGLSDLSVNPPAHRATWQGTPVHLTTTEFNLLVALLQCGDRVATRDHLSRNILGRPWENYDRSVDVHANHLRQKLLNATQGSIEIETVRGVGYRVRNRL
ncbi:Transcriptional regulatory protein cpxR [Novosphingobium sp. Rr 2-17]|uniref:response regulator n=1 Tax=Novosphingobium sp. Rr 2-17 TaxID=555793 RepID=UPI000269A239|nr:response regulator transcription factor [Novosphingobium sp. Rr 2-17]EIZ77861.1 Transcriptional regulatory protein cpxR [Novosphingobium sp. Rr 2-17]